MDFLQDLFVDVVNMSITASYAILFVLAARLLLKKAPKIFSYGLWGIVLFRLVCPFSFSSALSLLRFVGEKSGKMEYIPGDIGMMPQPSTATGVGVADSAVSASLPAAVPDASVNPMQVVLFVLSVVWALGIAFMLLYGVFSYIKLKHRVRTALLAEGGVFECGSISSPFVLGTIKPKIYLPSGLKDAERSYILEHERTHIRRFDYLIKPAAFMALCIHWFNPLVWLGFKLMTKDMEMSCDERVLRKMGTGIKKAYSESLLSLAAGGRIAGAGPLAFGESGVRSRIKNILNYRRPAFWATIAAVAVVAAAAAGLAANPAGRDTDHMSDTNSTSGADMRFIQVEVTKRSGRNITGRVVTDKDGYKAGDIVSVAAGDSVTYDVESLENGDWIDVGYFTVRETRPPVFEARRLNTIDGGYPTAFTLVENGEAIRSNILNNERVAAEMPALILSGEDSGIQSVNDVPYASRYLKIDIGADNSKVYYTYERNGKCYIEKPYVSIYEISRETFDQLMQYVYKGEIPKKTRDEIISEMPEPPGIEIRAAGLEIDYIVALNQWRGVVYDREDTFQAIMKDRRKTDLPYIQQGKEFVIEFNGTVPDSAELQDHILDAEGNVKYTQREIRTYPIEFKNKRGSFVLSSHPAAFLSSNSSDYEPGASVRGFRLLCRWGENECEYAFIIRTTALISG